MTNVRPNDTAFPASQDDTDGIDIRTYVAVEAMKSLLACEGDCWIVDQEARGDGFSKRAKALCRSAVKVADQMIEALNTKTEDLYPGGAT